MNVYKFLKGRCEEDGVRLFSVVLSAKTRGSGHKLEHQVFLLNIKKHFCTVQVTDHWHRVPREIVVSFLEIMRSCLDMVLDTLLWVSAFEQGLGQMDPEVFAFLSHSGVL